MKLSHLSLAIFSAIALAACGGSSSDDQVLDKPVDTNKGKDVVNQDQNDNQAGNEQKDLDIVDPTKDNVVDDISLVEDPTYASQQYIRSEKSKHDLDANPSNGNPSASTTVLSGVTLDKQNPQLTNIVIARAKGTNNKGEFVKISQYAGANDKKMESLRPAGSTTEASLQRINRPNALVSSVYSLYTTSGKLLSEQDTNGNFLNPVLWKMENKAGYGGQGYIDQNPFEFLAELYGWEGHFRYYNDYLNAVENYNNALKEVQKDGNKKVDYTTSLTALKSAINVLNSRPNTPIGGYTLSPKAVDNLSTVTGITSTVKEDIEKEAATINPVKAETIFNDTDLSELQKYGYRLHRVFWGGGFDATGFGDVYDASEKAVKGVRADNTGNEGTGPTHGLVAIYDDSANGNRTMIRGLEDNNVRTSRIFGHYYLDPGSANETSPEDEVENSWSGATNFITRLDSKNKADRWGLGAAPLLLNHVQYGRITAKVDPVLFEKESPSSGWKYRHLSEMERDPSKEGVADDFYFYRGTGATQIDEMAKLPTDTKINYAGHALMYGIDNTFHSGGQELPNSFGPEESYGLGNFVQAELDMGAKKFSGDVYNVWHSPEANETVKDVLVKFSGDVKGNTVIGDAKRAYMEETNPAVFRASFYGNKAQEVGGAFNAVTAEEVYSKDIKDNWGGVFGAHRTSSGSTAWLVSSERR